MNIPFLKSRTPDTVPMRLFPDRVESPFMSTNDADQLFARCFSSDDGRKVLAHLQAMTFARAHGPESSEMQLRHAEGQRALVAQIMRMVDRGRGPR